VTGQRVWVLIIPPAGPWTSDLIGGMAVQDEPPERLVAGAAWYEGTVNGDELTRWYPPARPAAPEAGKRKAPAAAMPPTVPLFAECTKSATHDPHPFSGGHCSGWQAGPRAGLEGEE
jgi:hypothetical protein